MVDVRLMQAAVAVAEELSFSRAAAKLGSTQSAITKQIHELEDRVGRELFRRNKRTVEVTEAGLAFVAEARQALLFTERAELSARAQTERAESHLRLGRSPYTDPFLITIALSVKLSLFPDLRLSLSSNISPTLSHQLLAGSVDVAILNGMTAPAGLSSTCIASSPLYLAFGKHDPLANRRDVELTTLTGRRWVLFERHVNPAVYDHLQRIAESEKVVPSDVQFVTTADEALPFITEHKSVAVLTQSGAWRIARDGIGMRPLADDRLILKTYIAARLGDDSRLVSEFVRGVVRKLRALSQPVQQHLPLAG